MTRTVRKWLWIAAVLFLMIFTAQIYITQDGLPRYRPTRETLHDVELAKRHLENPPSNSDGLPVNSKIINGLKLHPTNYSYSPKHRDCQPKNHFAYIKLEKTGSTTIMMMLVRYMLLHDLNLLGSPHPLPLHFDSSGDRDQQPGWTIGPHRNELADVWMNHARYNSTLIRNKMQPDTLVFTCIREPVSWFKSAVKYFTAQAWFEPRSKKNSPPDKVLGDDSLFYINRTPWLTPKLFHNQQLLWLGQLLHGQRYSVTAY